MKIAIGLKGDFVSDFFGSCHDFRLVTIEQQHITHTEDIFNDEFTHKLRPAYLKRLGVDVLIFNGMGLTAYDLLKQEGIQLVQAPNLSVDEALQAFLLNQLQPLQSPGGQHC